MSASPFRAALLAAAVFAISPCAGLAQKAPGMPGGVFTDNYNFQLFEPFDLDLDNLPVRDKVGYFFRYDKLYWAPSSERTTVGYPGQTAVSEMIFRDTPSDDIASNRDAPQSYTVINDIQDAAPQSEFGWGERYEFGYTDERGVTLHIGILDGPSAKSEQTYGFAPVAVDIFGEVAVPTQFGFGSVHVNFRSSDPNVPIEELLLGFRDYGIAGEIDGDGDDDNIDAPIEVVLVGPGFNENEGFIDAPQFPNVPDGEVDNIDGDTVGGAFFVVNGLGEVIGFGYDFDDLHLFNIRFEQLTTRSVTETQGVELMKTWQLDNRNGLRRQQHNRLHIGYGFRLFRLKDSFFYGGDTDLFGQTFADTDADNQLIGPQIRAMWTQHRGPWTIGADARFMAAVNFQDVGLNGGIGEEAIAGGANNSAVLQPTWTAIGRRDEAFSPLIEFRLDARYHFSQSLALRLGYTAMFVDNISRSSQLIGYTLPNYTLNPTSEQDIFYNGLSFGIEGQY